jgi:hypothetical protein
MNLATGQWLVEDLETFTVRRRGRPLRAADFNFWGVTFTPDARTFYATLGTGGETLLVTGDVDARTVEVIEDNDQHVLYALPGATDRAAIMDEWVVPADGGGEPRLFLPQAYSAAVVLGDPDLGSEQGTEAPKPSPAR